MSISSESKHAIMESVESALRQAPNSQQPLEHCANAVWYDAKFGGIDDDATLYEADDEFDPVYAYASDEPNEVIVRTPAELFFAARSLSRIAAFELPVARVTETIAHEREHMVVAQNIGFQAIRYGLAVTKEQDGNVKGGLFSEAQSPDTSISKLAVAAMVAAPAELAENDVATIISLGYENLTDVAMRIRETNAKAGYELLPEPLSLQQAVRPPAGRATYVIDAANPVRLI